MTEAFGRPSGTVTFLFTDIAGSTRLWQDYPAPMSAAYARHDGLLRSAVAAESGVVYKVIGDAFQAAFPTAELAVAAALKAQRAFLAEDWRAFGLDEPLRVRMALHTVAATPDSDGDYRTPGLNRLGRLMEKVAGGQVLLSGVTAGLAHDRLPAGGQLRDLGQQRLKDLYRPENVYELVLTERGVVQTPRPAHREGSRRLSSMGILAIGMAVALSVAVLGLFLLDDRSDDGNDVATATSLPEDVVAMLTAAVSGEAALLGSATGNATGPIARVILDQAPSGSAWLGLGELNVGNPGIDDSVSWSAPVVSVPGTLVLLVRDAWGPNGGAVRLWAGDRIEVARGAMMQQPGGNEVVEAESHIELQMGDVVTLPAGTPFALSTDRYAMGGIWMVGIFPDWPPPPLSIGNDVRWWSFSRVEEWPEGPIQVNVESIIVEPGDSARLETGIGPTLLWWLGGYLHGELAPRILLGHGAIEIVDSMELSVYGPPSTTEPTPGPATPAWVSNSDWLALAPEAAASPEAPYIAGVERAVGGSEFGPMAGLAFAPDTVASLRNPTESFTSFWAMTVSVTTAGSTPTNS